MAKHLDLINAEELACINHLMDAGGQVMRKCPECTWTYDESDYALDRDAEGRDLVPYHGVNGRPFSPRGREVYGRKKACRGSRQQPQTGEHHGQEKTAPAP